MLQGGHWFTEEHEDAGTAFSLRIEARLEEVQSRFQKIEIYQTTDFGMLMVIDGYAVLSNRDNFLYHEMLAHPVLFTHAWPRRVCIVGGGDCGTLREVLKHQEVEQVVQVEIDEQVTRLAERHFPELCDSNADPRADLLFRDGIRWMAERAPGSLDVIIVDGSDPVAPAEGLVGADFLRDCLRALDQGGLLVQQSESPLYHTDILREHYAALRRVGFAGVQPLFFPRPLYPSGWWSATLARKGETIAGLREEDVNRRSFPTRYYNAEIHRAALAVPEFIRVEVE